MEKEEKKGKMKGIKLFIMGLIALIALLFILWNALPGWISSKLSHMAKVAVSISHIDFTPGSISVNHFSMANPPGSVLKKALEVAETSIDIPFTHFFRPEIVIDQIEMKGVYVGLEFERKGSAQGNWTAIMGNIQQAGGSGKKSDKSVLIKKTLLRDIQVDLVFRDQGKKITRLKPIPFMELDQISSNGQFPTGQITQLVIDQMLRQIFSIENLGNMLESVLSPSGTGKNVFQGLKGLFSEAEAISE